MPRSALPRLGGRSLCLPLALFLVGAAVGVAGDVVVERLPNAPVTWTHCPAVPMTLKYSPAEPESETSLPRLELVPQNNLSNGFDQVPANPTFFALMITGKDEAHEFLARKSMESFVHQAATRKVLVIVNDSPSYSLTGPVSDWLAAVPNSALPEPPACVIEIRVEPQRYTLGDLRNIGINAVPLGGVWVQWDDDDWHERQYMTSNAQQMLKSKKHALTIQSQYRYFFARNSSYAYKPSSSFGIEGTVMVFKTPTVAPIQYRPQGKSEDSYYIMALLSAHIPTGTWDNPPWLYFRFYHGINTWSGLHYNINKLPDDNAWCSNLANQTHGCPNDIDNELHSFVIAVYEDVLDALKAAPKPQGN